MNTATQVNRADQYEDPLEQGSKRKGKKYPVEVLTKRELSKMLLLLDRDSLIGKRDMAAVVLMYRAGLRVREALELRVKDIDFSDKCVVHVLHGKGDYDRRVALDERSARHLKEWISAAELKMDEPVLQSIRKSGRFYSRGEPMSYPGINKRLKVMADDAGVKKRVSCHVFRHTMAYEMLMEGINIMVISKQLGHKSVATTVVYLDHLCPSERFKVTEGRKW